MELFELIKVGGQKLQSFVGDIWKKIADWFLKNKELVLSRYEKIANITAKELDWMASRRIGKPDNADLQSVLITIIKIKQ